MHTATCKHERAVLRDTLHYFPPPLCLTSVPAAA